MGAPGNLPADLPPWLQTYLGGSSKSATPTAPSSGFQTDPNTGISMYWNGSTWVPVSAALQKVIDGTTSVSGAANNYHLDPRELQLEYDKLQNSLTTQQMSDLKDLITNRNTESVGLANTYVNAADKAAQFAAKPSDAVADLMYRKAVGLTGQGTTPYGSISNDSFKGLDAALADKMQAMFGPAASALQRAGEFVGQIPPSEYLSPPSVGGGATAAAGGGGGGASAAVPVSTTPNPTATNPETGPTPYSDMPGGTPTHLSKGGTIGINPTLPGGGPRVGMSSSEGGTNMNVHEPAMVVGKSGHVYATIAENAPEQLIVKPLPSVQKYQKDQQAQNAKFLKSTAGATRNDAGGGITFGTDPSQFMDQLRQMFSMRGLSGTGALPDPRLLAGDQGQDILRDPDLSGYVNAGYNALGISSPELDYTINRFRPAGIRPELPKVVF